MPDNKYGGNIKINVTHICDQYTESSLNECSSNIESENNEFSTLSKVKLGIFDEINVTFSEQFFKSFKMIYEDILCPKSELKPQNLYESRFNFDNQVHML
ncbi:hypothetical protein RF11_06871 [Thelohanellus kitauei]|uniref:Uncharacterized protein n=1 Tax=Thelohanellus kitauei TaxID=669202 RepID=A0A0C2MD56_THEKT|nr:hypothetical protein RF11_06871 [Thelohanellus kitauei]